MGTDLVDLAHRLTNSGEAYCLATVVWRRGPSSAKEGYKALITEDEKVHGWVAGACTEPLMVRQARKAMRDGQPRLMLIGAPEDIDTRSRDGLLTFPQTCLSEGALEVFVEPVIPSPHLVIIGRSPVVGVMVEMARALGWRTAIVDDEGESGPPDGSSADKVVNSLDLAEAGVGRGSFVVVATQGHYDEDALEQALKTEAAYVGLVSSRKRAESVFDYLRDAGVGEEDLGRVRAPAGLDLGKVRHEEIAVGVIAELVQLRAAAQVEQPSGAPPDAAHHHATSAGDGSRPQATGSPTAEPAEARAEGADTAPDTSVEAPPAAKEEPAEAIDPVCGMIVEVASARYKSDLEGKTYYFCCPACRKKFQADPHEYLDKVKQEA